MVSRLFAHASKAIHRTFRETGGCLWLRQGHTQANRIDCTFVEQPRVVDLDGISTVSSNPEATFQLSDIAKIDGSRAALGKDAFRNRGRDTLTINGKSYAVESCTADGYGWITAVLTVDEDESD